MRYIDKSIIGKRVKLLSCTDPYTKLTYGDEGVVDFIDDIGTVFVNWDNGSTLGMVYEDGDRFATCS